MHHRDGMRPRQIDDNKQNMIIKDLVIKMKKLNNDNKKVYSSTRHNNINKLKKIRMMNLKNRIKMFERKSSTNSDYNTYDINKSTNLDDLSLMYQEREKLSSIHSMRNISNKNIYLPKIQKQL